MSRLGNRSGHLSRYRADVGTARGRGDLSRPGRFSGPRHEAALPDYLSAPRTPHITRLRVVERMLVHVAVKRMDVAVGQQPTSWAAAPISPTRRTRRAGCRVTRRTHTAGSALAPRGLERPNLAQSESRPSPSPGPVRVPTWPSPSPGRTRSPLLHGKQGGNSPEPQIGRVGQLQGPLQVEFKLKRAGLSGPQLNRPASVGPGPGPPQVERARSAPPALCLPTSC